MSTTLQTLCQQCVARMSAQGLKGKARDKASLEFMIGAYAALHVTLHPDAEHVGTVVGLVIAPRGYAEIGRIATTRANTGEA